MVGKQYWETRKNWYREMVSHIKEQRDHATKSEERIKLSRELERIYNEINYINDNCLK